MKQRRYLLHGNNCLCIFYCGNTCSLLTRTSTARLNFRINSSFRYTARLLVNKLLYVKQLFRSYREQSVPVQQNSENKMSSDLHYQLLQSSLQFADVRSQFARLEENLKAIQLCFRLAKNSMDMAWEFMNCSKNKTDVDFAAKVLEKIAITMDWCENVEKKISNIKNFNIPKTSSTTTAATTTLGIYENVLQRPSTAIPPPPPQPPNKQETLKLFIDMHHDCPVCLETFKTEQMVACKCSHWLCGDCFSKMRTAVCPLCNDNITDCIVYKLSGDNLKYKSIRYKRRSTTTRSNNMTNELPSSIVNTIITVDDDDDDDDDTYINNTIDRMETGNHSININSVNSDSSSSPSSPSSSLSTIEDSITPDIEELMRRYLPRQQVMANNTDDSNTQLHFPSSSSSSLSQQQQQHDPAIAVGVDSNGQSVYDYTPEVQRMFDNGLFRQHNVPSSSTTTTTTTMTTTSSAISEQLSPDDEQPSSESSLIVVVNGEISAAENRRTRDRRLRRQERRRHNQTIRRQYHNL